MLKMCLKNILHLRSTHGQRHHVDLTLHSIKNQGNAIYQIEYIYNDNWKFNIIVKLHSYIPRFYIYCEQVK